MRTIQFVSILLSSAALMSVATSAMAQEAASPIHLAAVTDASQPAGIEPSWKVAPPEASEWTLTASDTVKSGRDFQKQGFTLTRNTVNELDVTACKEGLCFDFWRADTRVQKEHETDFQVWKTVALGAGTLQVKAAYYELAGPDVEDVTLTVSHAIGKDCTLEGSYEKDWGGFKEDAWQAKGSCTLKLSSRVSLDGSAMISHSRNFHQWVPAAEVGTSFTLTEHASFRPFVRGFLGRDPDTFVGATVSFH